MSNKLNIDNMPGEYKKRVFIGGNYDLLPTLREIAKYVKDFGFQPILAYDFDVSESDIHDYDLRLLHNCNYAIFDVTHSAGEVMELERCKDYGTRVMVVYQAREKERMPDQLSSMILTAGFRRRGFHEFKVLKEIVKEFILEEDGLFDLYLKVFGYKFETIESSLKINKDRTSNQITKYNGLEVVNENLTMTREGPHFFAIDFGKISNGPVFTTNRRDIVEWVEDEKKKRDTFYEGNIVFKDGLKKGDGSVNYDFEVDCEGNFCMTKEGFDELYPNDEFPYEYNSITIKSPVEILKLEVSFSEGYKVDQQPIAFFGRQRQEDAVTGQLVSFDREENKAILTVKRPKLFYDYGLFWEPMLKEEYEKLP
jgi:hypothetical protein